jgi:hypothetical protein
MPNLILELEVDRVDLVDEGANSAAFIKLYKRRETDVKMDFEQILAVMEPDHAAIIRETVAKAKTEVPEDVQADLEATKKSLEETTAKAASTFDELESMKKSKEKSEEPDFETVLKSMDPAMQKFVKNMKLKADAAEEAARQAAEKQIQDEAVAKARELKALPVEEDALVEVLKSASPEILEIFKAANAVIENSPSFEEVGKRNDGSNVNSGTAEAAWDKLVKKAKEIETRDGVSEAKAISKAMNENRELYREYLAGGAN